jgi:hypothetical protein
LENNRTTDPRDSPLARIGLIRELVISEVAHDFRHDRQAQAFGLLAQAILMEVRHRSSTECARGWLTVMHKIFDGDLDGAANAMVALVKLEPKIN